MWDPSTSLDSLKLVLNLNQIFLENSGTIVPAVFKILAEKQTQILLLCLAKVYYLVNCMNKIILN